MELKISIKLGNDAMMSVSDVKKALATVQSKLAASHPDDLIESPVGPRSIQDDNGNTVGFWEVAWSDDD